MKNIRFLFLAGLSLLSMSASAAEPQLEKSIAQGKDLFMHSTLEGKGKFCESCHLAGGTEPGKLPNGNAIPSLNNAATIFPRYNKKANKVVTLEDQVRNCTSMGLQGNAPAYGSEELNSIVSYLTSLSMGKLVDMGGKPL